MLYRKFEKEKQYFEQVLQKTSLTKEERNFIEKLLKEVEGEKDRNGYFDSYNYSQYEAEIRKKIERMEEVSFYDLFPKEISGGLKAILGENLYPVFIKIGENITKYPYTQGYYRKPLRSGNYKYYFEKLLEILDSLIIMAAYDLDVLKVLKREYDTQKLYGLAIGEMTAASLGLQNEEVRSYIKELLTAENNHQVLTYDIFRAVFMAEDRELLELTKGLLLAAKLQEGLRQAICETMDRGSFSNFKEMFFVIYENNLLRFSSVKRALATWTGLTEEFTDRISKKELELIKNLLENETYADILLQSKDNVEAYFGLWMKGNTEVQTAITEILKIVETGEKHNRLLASYYLNFVGEDDLKRKVAKEMIKTYPEDREVLACFLNEFFSGEDYQVRVFAQNFKTEKNLIDSYFENREEAYQLFDILENHLTKIKTKTVSISPCIFPWYSVSLTREEIVSALFVITALLSEGDLKDRFTKYLKLGSSYIRGEMIELLYEKPKGRIQEAFLISMLSDRGCSSKTLFRLVEENNLFDTYTEKIEDLLRLKTAEIRRNAIDLLGKQDKEGLTLSVRKLLGAKDENKRLGGLDLLGNAKKQGVFSDKDVSCFIEDMGEISSGEEVLVNVLLEKKDARKITQVEYDEHYEKDYVLEFSDEEKGLLNKISGLFAGKKKATGEVIKINNSLKPKEIFDKKTEELVSIVASLSELIEKHSDYEYTTHFGTKTLIGNTITKETSDEEQITYETFLHNLPLFEVWEKFYREKIKNVKTLFQLVMLFDIPTGGYRYDREKPFEEVANEILGFDITSFVKLLRKKELPYVGSGHIGNLLRAMYAEYKREDREFVRRACISILSELYLKIERKKLFVSVGYSYYGESHDVIFEDSSFFSALWVELERYETKEEFQEVFFLKLSYLKELQEYANKNNITIRYTFLSYPAIVKAVLLGFVDVSMFYRFAFENLSDYIRYMNDDIYGPRYKYQRQKKDDFLQNEDRRIFAREKGEELINLILDLELQRGDSPTPYSKAVSSIRHVFGVDRLLGILLALGKEHLDRNNLYYYGGDASKKGNLSYLLRHSEPLPDEDIKVFREKLKGKKITEKRLIEVSMYAPKWIPLIEEYLGWKGLASGCNYFRAHTSDVSRELEGLIGRYSPISIERFQDGAFDIDWFRESYESLGEDRFLLLYDASKYISDGAKHSRARMFADAVLGKLSLTETREEIKEKRNQNKLMSYSLIPLTEPRHEDILTRYRFLMNFLKESRQFGAQRRASEAKAVAISLENLARNAGYSDVTRLTCAMETAIIESYAEFFSPKMVEDTEIFIEIGELGEASILCKKNGKLLKSLPAKLKKHDYVIRIKETHKELKEQYIRGKKLFEQSMEDGVVFSAEEIENLMKNPVLMPILKTLVFRSEKGLGFFQELSLRSLTEEGECIIPLKPEEELKLAHALDLYREGSKVWERYQLYFFKEKIKQPFKQVFRELYVKTKEEEKETNSLRYAGHQVQPSKTIALLKTRRWMVEGEEGLQKVYYKENIVARIYALADWFSPAEIEAPTLEWVCFYDRKDGREMRIEEVPDLIFSEVMRDVDLAVSVAHVGGVDPETSHSTIEMRKAIFDLNLRLFKLNNVSFSENFALIQGKRGEYSVHLGSGIIHKKAGTTINVLPVHSSHRGRIFLPFVDEDPKMAEIMSKILLFAEDEKIKDPFILEQLS